MMFTIFDITIFAIISISAILGLYKGALKILINLLGFVTSIIAAIFLFPYVKSVFIEHIENQLVASILSGVVSYLFCLIILTLITTKVITLFNGISCGFFDRFLGVIVGTFRGLVISVIIFTITAVFSSGAYLKAQNAEEIILNLDAKKYPDWLLKSKTSNYLEELLKKSLSFLPDNSLKSIVLPKPTIKEDQDIIDDIKKAKNQESSLTKTWENIGKKLENDTDDLSDEQ